MGATVIVTVGSATRRRRPAWRSAPTTPSTTRPSDFVDEVKRLTGKARRQRDPRHGRGRLRRARARAAWPRTAGWSSSPCRAASRREGRCRPGAAQAPHRHRLDPAAAAGGVQERDRRGAEAHGLAAGSRAARVKPVIHEVFPAAEAAEAHALMESNAHIGKLVLHVVSPGERRATLVVGNWKMNGSRAANAALLARPARRPGRSRAASRSACRRRTSARSRRAAGQRHRLGCAGLFEPCQRRLHRRGLGGDARRVRLPLRHRRPLRAARAARRGRRAWWPRRRRGRWPPA